MITSLNYQRISLHPEMFFLLIGMRLSDFDLLFYQFEIVYTFEQIRLREKKPRLRQVGGGRHHKYALRDRLLLTLFWINVKPTHLVLSNLVGLHRSNLAKILKDTKNILKDLTGFDCPRSDGSQKKMCSVQAMFQAFPEICLLQDFQSTNADGGDYDLNI